MSGDSTVGVGLGVTLVGGFLTALAGIGGVSFGLLPVGFFAIGVVVLGAGFYEKFVLEKTLAPAK